MVCSVNILPFVDDLLARCRATLDCMGYAVIVADLESRITLFKGKVTYQKENARLWHYDVILETVKVHDAQCT